MENQSKSNLPMVIGIVVVVLVLGGAGMLLLNSNQNSNPVTTTSTELSNTNMGTTTPVSDTEAPTLSDDARVVAVEGGSFYYKPDKITAKVGEKIRIELKSVDMMHDFVIDELNVRTQIIKSGDTGVVEFTPTEAGEFEFYCSVGNHKAQGMVGTLVVE